MSWSLLPKADPIEQSLIDLYAYAVDQGYPDAADGPDRTLPFNEQAAALWEIIKPADFDPLAKPPRPDTWNQILHDLLAKPPWSVVFEFSSPPLEVGLGWNPHGDPGDPDFFFSDDLDYELPVQIDTDPVPDGVTAIEGVGDAYDAGGDDIHYNDSTGLYSWAFDPTPTAMRATANITITSHGGWPSFFGPRPDTYSLIFQTSLGTFTKVFTTATDSVTTVPLDTGLSAGFTPVLWRVRSDRVAVTVELTDGRFYAA